MIIPKHKVCDFCKEPVGVNKRYYKIKSKNYLVGYAGSCSDNRTHHICEDCMQEFITYLHSKLRGNQKDIDIPEICKECHSQSYNNGFDAGYELGKKDREILENNQSPNNVLEEAENG